MKYFKFLFVVIFFLNTILLFGQANQNKPLTKEEVKEKWEKLAEKTKIDVIGDNKDSLKKIPGSATVVSKKYLDETQPVDAMEVLRRVPGASARFMDSAGLTPNISFRGVSNEESRKTLFLEDGVLTSLSPYGQPESYYFPNIDRMQRVEVVKGSGSILFGPSTIGGVINLVTRRAPRTPVFSNKTIAGNNGFVSNFTQYGGTWGKTSVDVSHLHKHGDGYRDFNFFNANDFYLKVVHEINDKHSVTLKLGYNEQKSRASYLGLTQGLFWKNYKTNPAEFDVKELNRSSSVLGHEYRLNEKSRIITKIYGTGARRDWQRQDFAYNNLTSGGSVAIPPSDLYATYAPAPIGNRSGDILYMRQTAPMRNQGFATLGIETKLETSLELFGLKNEIDAGVRAHGEMNKINFKQSYPPINYPFIRDGISFNQQNRDIRAYAVYLQDRISATDKLKLIPGLRYENVSQGVYTTRRKATAKDVKDKIATNSGDILFINKGTESYTKILLPGFGITYDILNELTWFAGAHKSFSPPTFGTAISPYGEDYRLGAESATNYETGFRGDVTKYLFIETAVYMMNFRDQVIDTSEVSSETGSRPVNTGKSSHKGFENSITFDFGKFFEKGMEIPLDLIYSKINAKNETYDRYPHSIDPENKIQFINRPLVLLDQNGRVVNPDINGRHLPYVPEDVFIVALGIRLRKGFYARAEYQHIAKQYGALGSYRNLKPGQLDIKEVNGISYANVWNTNDETPDGNTGIIPAVGLVNASIGYKNPEKKWSIFIVGKNLQDRIYVSGRLPTGIHPGPTRQINFGISFDI